LFGGDVVGLSVATRYRASKSDAPTHNLPTYHRILFVMAFCCDYISDQIFEPICLYGRFHFPSNVESFSLRNLGDLPFDQVIPMLFLVSAFLLNSLKFDGIASSHMHHFIVINLQVHL
jgi:hypothetical protein